MLVLYLRRNARRPFNQTCWNMNNWSSATPHCPPPPAQAHEERPLWSSLQDALRRQEGSRSCCDCIPCQELWMKAAAPQPGRKVLASRGPFNLQSDSVFCLFGWYTLSGVMRSQETTPVVVYRTQTPSVYTLSGKVHHSEQGFSTAAPLTFWAGCSLS